MMKEIVPVPPAIVHNQFESVRELFTKNVVPSYGRFDLALSHGSGSAVFDVAGNRYLDLGGGIAVTCLGHAHPAITEALVEQSKNSFTFRTCISPNLRAGWRPRWLVASVPAKCFSATAGAEANEGLYKLARKFGHDEGRFEILTALNSFHGRTLGGIAATGQDKVKKGFEPMIPGFRHIPYNDLSAAREAISPATMAILIEGIQGEGGVTAATAEYLLGLRALCDEKKLLLLMDGVQCGHFRTGKFQSFQRILENIPGGGDFLPDGLSMAKSLGGGFPIGAFWLRAPFADLLSAGTHGTTFGGSPLACAVALSILEVIKTQHLADHARNLGAWISAKLDRLVQQYPAVVKNTRGLGLMLGFELAEQIPAFASSQQPVSLQFCRRLHAAGLLTAPAGAQVIRLLPALNLKPAEAAEGIAKIESVLKTLA